MVGNRYPDHPGTPWLAGTVNTSRAFLIERVGSTHTPGYPAFSLNYRPMYVVGWARAPASWVPVALQGLTGLSSHQLVLNMRMFHVKH